MPSPLVMQAQPPSILVQMPSMYLKEKALVEWMHCTLGGGKKLRIQYLCQPEDALWLWDQLSLVVESEGDGPCLQTSLSTAVQSYSDIEGFSFSKFFMVAQCLHRTLHKSTQNTFSSSYSVNGSGFIKSSEKGNIYVFHEI